MLVKVEMATSETDRADVANRLDQHFRQNLGVRLSVEIVDPGALPRYELKTKRIFDTRGAT
jgi:phenylacetate-CoA ligase